MSRDTHSPSGSRQADLRRPLASGLVAAALWTLALLPPVSPFALCSRAFAQDEEVAEDAPPVKPAPRKARTGESSAKGTGKAPSKGAGKTSAKTGARASAKPTGEKSGSTKAAGKKKSGSASVRAEPIPAGALEALDQALGAFLTEKRLAAVVAQEAADEGPELTVAIETLDQSLEAQLKKGGRQPVTPSGTKVTAGLTAVLNALKDRSSAAASAPAATAASGTTESGGATTPPEETGPVGPPPVPSTSVEATAAPEVAATPEGPPPTAVAALPRETSPPPAPADPESEAPVRPPGRKSPPAAITPQEPNEPPDGSETTPAGTPSPGFDPAPPTSATRRYTLSRIVVSRDGGPEQDLPIPSGGALRPIPLAHRTLNPTIETKLLVRAPAEVSLGEPTQLTAQATAQAAGVAAELSLLDEVVDTVRAPEGAEAVTASGTVQWTLAKKVGGVYAYTQTFAQGDGRSPSSTASRSILLNWTDRDSTIEMPFAWTTTSPGPLSIRGRLVYAPATRP